MGNAFSFVWEDKLIILIQRFIPGFLVKFASLISDFGDATLLVGVLGLFYWALNKELAKKLFVHLSFVNIVNPCLKSTVRRLRPYMVNRDIQCLKPVNSEGDIYDVVSQEFSFPSGHAANSIAVYGTLFRNSKKGIWKTVLVLLILFIGISRFTLGVHYPTDVLAGWLISALCISLYSLLEKKIGRNKAFVLLDILGIAGFFIARTNDFYTGYGMLLGGTLGIMFEEKAVNFEGTKKFLPALLRTLIGVGLYFGLNSLLKLPFTEEFLNSGTLPAFMIRAARYTAVVFTLIGLYPLTFKIGKSRRSEASPEGE